MPDLITFPFPPPCAGLLAESVAAGHQRRDISDADRFSRTHYLGLVVCFYRRLAKACPVSRQAHPVCIALPLFRFGFQVGGLCTIFYLLVSIQLITCSYRLATNGRFFLGSHVWHHSFSQAALQQQTFLFY